MEIKISCFNVFLGVLLNELSISIAGAEVRGDTEVKILKQKGKLDLDCGPISPLSPTQYQNQKVQWTKDNETVVASDMYKIEGSKLHMGTDGQGTDSLAGNYTCTILSENKTAFTKNFEVMTELYLKLQSYVSSVEEEQLKIVATILGKPAPEVQWMHGNSTWSKSIDRVTLKEDEERHVANAVFLLDKATKNDKGEYSCYVLNPKTGANMTRTTTVYIKGKLDALWPFLGIVAEVVVLCAIILVYEKKRNNNAELEESDTDQSPDQKNTPDHGKDSVRHRK